MAEQDQGATPISRADARLLAAAYGLPEEEIVTDARIADAWNGPADDLLLWLKGRHRWPSSVALSYLGGLRFALGRGPEPR
jgi:hypothetical protein